MHAMSAWLVKTRRAPSRHSRDARIYGHATTAMNKLSTPPPPSLRGVVPRSCFCPLYGSCFSITVIVPTLLSLTMFPVGDICYCWVMLRASGCFVIFSGAKSWTRRRSRPSEGRTRLTTTKSLRGRSDPGRSARYGNKTDITGGTAV